MNSLAAALWAETIKARRSKAPWLTAIGFSLAPLVGGLFMLILQDPAWARRSGLITTKAQLSARAADWPTYFSFLAQATAVGGLIVFGIVAVWVFGREYHDRAVKDLLALPTGRSAIIGAKFIVVAVWVAGLEVVVYALGLTIGAAIDLPGWSPGMALQATGEIAATAGLTMLLVTPFAWIASAGRGYLPAIGAMFLVLFCAQIAVALGWGAYFPWSAPALFSNVDGSNMQELSFSSYVLVVLVGLLGCAGTVAWWEFADQT